MDLPVDLPGLYMLRVGNDNQETDGYAYGVIGVDSHINDWNVFGVDNGLMPHSWRDELDQLMILPRGEANRMLMDRLRKDSGQSK